MAKDRAHCPLVLCLHNDIAAAFTEGHPFGSSTLLYCIYVRMPSILFTCWYGDNLCFAEPNNKPLLPDFLAELINNEAYNPSHIRWLNKEERVFLIVKPKIVAGMWGSRKGNPNMNYPNMSRGMRSVCCWDSRAVCCICNFASFKSNSETSTIWLLFNYSWRQSDLARSVHIKTWQEDMPYPVA